MHRRSSNGLWTHRCHLLITGLTLTVFAAKADEVDDLLKSIPSKWDTTVSVRTSAGYKDNVLLGNNQVFGSAFVAAGMDALVWRMPVDGWEYSFLTSADFLRYLPGNAEVDHELTVLAETEVKKHFNHGWSANFGLEYLYLDQVFDDSAFERELQGVPVQGHSIGIRPGTTWNFTDKDWFEFQFYLSRQQFMQVIDSYWEGGPKLILGHHYGYKSEFTVSYQFDRRFHDNREPRTPTGTIIPGETLIFNQQELALSLKHYWDEERRWRTVSKLGLERIQDNGPGYYDYWRPSIAQQIRYEASAWNFRADAKLSYYNYDKQTLSETDLSLRRRMTLVFGLRAERKLTKSLSLFGEYQHEQALSNLTIDRYEANTISGGLNWEF